MNLVNHKEFLNISTHIEIEVLLPDIENLNKFDDFSMAEFGNKAEIDNVS